MRVANDGDGAAAAAAAAKAFTFIRLPILQYYKLFATNSFFIKSCMPIIAIAAALRMLESSEQSTRIAV
jgi:hypothetical protein